MHLECDRLDFLERWIYDNESDSFFVEDFASSNMQSELTISTDKTITYSRPLLTVIQNNQSSFVSSQTGQKAQPMRIICSLELDVEVRLI